MEGAAANLKTLEVFGSDDLGKAERAPINDAWCCGYVVSPMAAGALLPEAFKLPSEPGPEAGAALGKWPAVDGAAASLKTLALNDNPGLGDEGVAAIAEGLAAGGVALEELHLGNTKAAPKAGAALVKWLRVESAAANLKELNLSGNSDLGGAEQAAITASSRTSLHLASKLRACTAMGCCSCCSRHRPPPRR